jgi:lipopolysaccharide export system protein LptA
MFSSWDFRMRLRVWTFALLCLIGSPALAEAKDAPAPSSGQLEVTADNSLEWYEDQGIYVARGNAKAVRGDLTVSADLLTAHKRDGKGNKNGKTSEAGDIDRMTAEGNVVVLKGSATLTAERGVYDFDQRVVVATGKNLRYETEKQIVTARDSMEYWEAKKIAVARGNAKAVQGDRHISGDALTAEFRSQPNGTDQLYKMTAAGNVTVITKTDVVRGDKAVYDAARNIAIVTGHVAITRPDGTQLTGDVGEADFATNRSRLLNEGTGRVRALLPAKSTQKKSVGETP